MKIVVIGGTGLIGSKLVTKLREHGHDAIAASPDTGVNTLTGEGLDEVLKGASVVVDVSNSPSFEDAAVLNFFETSTRNLLTHEAAAGVGHHVALSVVGADRLAASGSSGYMRAKVVQERLIRERPQWPVVSPPQAAVEPSGAVLRADDHRTGSRTWGARLVVGAAASGHGRDQQAGHRQRMLDTFS